MKNSIYIILIMLGLYFVVSPAQAQKAEMIKTDTVHVAGNCGMCKERIENAALIKGVKKATWDKKTHQLIVIYKSDKVTLEEIEKEVAKAGHDTDHFKANDDVYNSLPNCCLYRSGDIPIH